MRVAGRAGGPPRAGQGGLPRPRRPQRAHPALGERRPPGRGGDGGDSSTSTWGTSSGPPGTVARTRRGELSVAVDEVVLLAKALRPPPDKHAGLRDPETALPPALPRPDRPTPRCADAFVTRSRAIAAVRRFLDDRGFVEVETPTLQPIYGGAAARPVRDPPQRARPRPLPAHRHRALPQALHRRGASRRSTSWARTSATRASATSTTPSSRWSRPTRPTRTTAT